MYVGKSSHSQDTVHAPFGRGQGYVGQVGNKRRRESKFLSLGSWPL